MGALPILALSAAVCFMTTAMAHAKSITATLKLKEKVSMVELARQVSTPGSPRYGRFYEPLEIRQIAGPSDEEYGATLANLKAAGFEVIYESPTHLWVTVRGEKSRYESLFATQIQTIANGMYKPLTRITVPIRFSLVDSVIGLDNTRKAHPQHSFAATTGRSKPRAVSQGEIKRAYGFNPIYASGVNGAGVDIAIATYDSFNIEHIRTFYKVSHISPEPVVDTIGFNGETKYEDDSAGETELDAELAGMLAPGVRIHVFPSATNDDAGEVQMFTAILDDNRAKIVNYSWGSCEDHLTPQHKIEMEKVFARAVAQGVNILVSSGDNGSDSCGDHKIKADWPAGHPAILSVGGTTLIINRGQAAETAWSGSGGGISAHLERPAWQQQLGFPFVRRSYPDVAFNADPRSGQSVYIGKKSEWMTVGGTSIAAPQWAGFLALVEQARRLRGKTSLPFLPPVFYGMDQATRALTFNDVSGGSNGAYSARAGWDPVTGWGSMKANSLLEYLTSLD